MSAPGETFEAYRKLIDDLKHEGPIWKHQVGAQMAVSLTE